uniref:Cell division cycle 40 n=1 Tax=Myotis myotis TaxID=51298 RepID=A0A7J7WUA4_MYOMY|nr:cell division cycle 40 [Myotis myotis]
MRPCLLLSLDQKIPLGHSKWLPPEICFLGMLNQLISMILCLNSKEELLPHMVMHWTLH